MFEVGKRYSGNPATINNTYTCIAINGTMGWLGPHPENRYGKSIVVEYHDLWKEVMPEPLRKYSQWQGLGNMFNQSPMRDSSVGFDMYPFVIRYDYEDYASNQYQQGYIKKLVNIEVEKKL